MTSDICIGLFLNDIPVVYLLHEGGMLQAADLRRSWNPPVGAEGLP